MSTRRARIKAVASLPVRRKNQDNKDNIKKQNSPKQLVEKTQNAEEDAKIEIPSENVEKGTVSTFENSSSEAKITPDESQAKSPGIPKNRKQSTPQRVPSPRLVRPSPVYRLPPSPLVTHNYDAYSLNKPPTPSKVDDKAGENHVQDTQALKETLQSVAPTFKSKNDIDGIDKIPDYNPPSIPESIGEENVLDGIVPLQTVRSVPKPLDLLKNELISDNAEVLFDPIVPLPSPSKVRPKLRPVPRLAFRRNSIQGSASESEDESRRALLSSGATTPGPPRQRHDSHASHTTQFTVPNREVTRVRNDSVCSVMSQQGPLTALSASSSTSLLKDKNAATKSRRTDINRRMSAMRRRQRRERNAPRDALTMYDLIFYNPTTNPIVPEEPAKVHEEIIPNEATNESTKVVDEAVDDPTPKQDSAPVPQIKLGPNGEIILDEKSLVIEQTENQRKLSSSLVVEGVGALGSGGRYSRAPRSADWSDAETVRFYRALAAIGTDFTLMKPLFPDRTRRDLKVKFKKEERLNGAQVDKALRSQTQWDALTLQDEFAEERKRSAEKAEQKRMEYIEQKKLEKARIKAAKEDGMKQSRATKAMESSNGQEARHTADEVVQRALEAETRTKLERKVKKKIQNEKFATVTPYRAQNTPLVNPNFALLTPLDKVRNVTPTTSNVTSDMVHITKLPQVAPKPLAPNLVLPNVPKNIETGSLVVLTVNDPNEPSKKILQTYISHSSGQLTPVALPASLLSSVMTYMKKGTPKRGISSNSSPHLTSPSSVASQDSRSSVIQINPSPSKRIRHSSFSITEL